MTDKVEKTETPRQLPREIGQPNERHPDDRRPKEKPKDNK
jgi:hypothetical protein